MPPLLRILLACCAANLAGIARAHERVSSEYAAPRPHSSPAFGQPSLAQHYLAAPLGGASADNRPKPGMSAESSHEGGASDLLNQGASVAEPQPEPRTAAPRDPAMPAEEAGRWDAPGFGTMPPSSSDAWEDRESGVAPAAFEEEPAEPPQLFPAPAVPLRPAPVSPDAPERETSKPRGAAESVSPVRHFSEEVAVPAADAAASPEEPAASPKEPPAGAMPLQQPREAMPLQAPGAPGSEGGRRRAGGLPSVVTVVGGLAVVLGIFFMVAWGMRRAAPKALTTLPSQVVEVLGRAPLAGRQQVHLLRCGSKLLLVSVTPDAAETLTEITDREEVDRLAGLCEQVRPHSSSTAFRRVFHQFAREGEGAYEH